MGCACSDQKHGKDSKSKGHEHHNSSNSNASHVSIATFFLLCPLSFTVKNDNILFSPLLLLLMSADSICVILLEYYVQFILYTNVYISITCYLFKYILVNKQMNHLIYSCQEITGSKATIKVIHMNLLLQNMASGERFSLNTDYSLIKNHFEYDAAGPDLVLN